MSLPVSNIPTQQIPMQPSVNVGQVTGNKQQPASPNALPAKDIKKDQKPAAPEQNNMKLGKPAVGVLTPPSDSYKFSLNKQIQDKQKELKEVTNASPLAASNLSEGGNKGGGIGSFFTKLALLTGTIAGGIFLAKKIKLSNVDSIGIATVSDLKKHLADVVDVSKKGKLKPFHLKNTSVRVKDTPVVDVKDILNTTRNIATEARNVDGKTPKITVKFKEGAGEAPAKLKEAISQNKIDDLEDGVIKHIEYVNLEYVPSEKGNTDVLINTSSSKFVNGSIGSDFAGKVEQFFKDFLGD